MRRDCGPTLAGPRFFTSRTAPEAPACDDGTAKSSNSGSQLAPTRSIWARLRAVHWTSSATLAGRVWSRRTTDALRYVINAITAANGMRPVCSALLGTSRFYISPAPVATTHRPISTSFVHCTAHIDFMPNGEQCIWSGSPGSGSGRRHQAGSESHAARSQHCLGRFLSISLRSQRDPPGHLPLVLFSSARRFFFSVSFCAFAHPHRPSSSLCRLQQDERSLPLSLLRAPEESEDLVDVTRYSPYPNAAAVAAAAAATLLVLVPVLEA
ncbi:hypothetical protein HETIRDRAFT_104462 [Heterobasidion irregulare TC 32-1]|uniref:Uncharacterized protein n=1 Tax=Heterobasidion irregulare (strain TC 32-1) TaxID=747525 RepID=W4K1F7_HETIT|nr:uncharacterized protein HETIRDRAFT_104462 [Heterobasidion irregulare TC 32-1]ETW79175.1 hypothetical protein HETIRDRAFT_104462 [Heterobasidion irregulare TC 32-1]